MLTVIKFICRTAWGQAEGQRFSKHQRLGKHISRDIGMKGMVHASGFRCDEIAGRNHQALT
ncbi:hypothetical protein [Rhizobium leguminosarum]|uniref:hypothetical protein n=1 Tax=Rhizobium leguminosarum TaxID=384 RepID=UPI001031F91A|nr:hypothetical protein [Rhizobium leguminosarum]TAY98645.1 hypothetical protein ELH79_09275 [Rhizobium leguminosarum]TAZ09410.1 hypothetical protein ELH78_09275 [Rhizobium leguminosarum]